MNPNQALYYLKQRHPIANPNKGFVRQLYQYYQKLQINNNLSKFSNYRIPLF